MKPNFLWNDVVLFLFRPISEGSDFLIAELIALLLVVAFAGLGVLLFRRARLSARQRLALPTEEKEPLPTPKAKPTENQTQTQSQTQTTTATETANANATGPQTANWNSALKKSRDPLLSRLQDVWTKLSGGEVWGDEHPVWEALEETLITSDIGPKLTARLLDGLKQEFRERPDAAHLRRELRQRMEATLLAVPVRDIRPESGPRVTLLMGVNGSGKTTTAGKLAYQAKQAGKLVVLGAGDTFRAAAVDQLQAWADRIGVECIVPAKGANPAAVAFDAVAAGLARNADEIIIDTAGRLHTKDSLMDELRKVGKVIEKKIPGAPHRVLLVLDATLGQNAIIQAREFTAALPATGVVLTKLDGSAKGGAALSVVAELGLPVELVGVGETPEALRPFSPREFAANLIPDHPVA